MQNTDVICSVSPIYYVTFTTAVLTASFLLFQGFDVTDEVKSASLLSGFLTIFTGVYLLNFNGSDVEVRHDDYELTSIHGPASARPSFQHTSAAS